MDKYLEDFEKAVANIPDYYLDTKVIRSHDLFIGSQGIERSFMCELYHQWRKIVDKSSRYKNLKLQATIGKKIGTDTVEFPDIVLHGGQFGKHHYTNKVFVEIKMDTYSSDDVDKIFRGISNLDYSCGIYILFNMDYSSIVDEVRKNFHKDFSNYSSYFHKFYFFSKSKGKISAYDLIKSESIK